MRPLPAPIGGGTWQERICRQTFQRSGRTRFHVADTTRSVFLLQAASAHGFFVFAKMGVWVYSTNSIIKYLESSPQRIMTRMENTIPQPWIPAQRRKVPQEIAHGIRVQILSGTLPKGSKLPSEQDLTAALNVSRQTLREGLRILEAQGLLQIKAGQNGGAFVTDVREETACIGLVNFLHNKQLSLAHLTEIRKLVEPYLIQKAVKKITDTQIHELESLQSQTLGAIKEGEFNRVRAIEIAFHNCLADIADNPLLSFINAFIGHVLLGIKQQLHPNESFSLAVLKSHDDILAALQQHDAEGAVMAITRDIEMAMEYLGELADEQGCLNWKFIVG